MILIAMQPRPYATKDPEIKVDLILVTDAFFVSFYPEKITYW
jgi:hypothetical protein